MIDHEQLADLLIEHDWRAERGDEIGAARCLLLAAGADQSNLSSVWFNLDGFFVCLSKHAYATKGSVQIVRGEAKNPETEPLLSFVRRAIIEITGYDVLDNRGTCSNCGACLYRNSTQVENDQYPLFECDQCNQINFWD